MFWIWVYIKNPSKGPIVCIGEYESHFRVGMSFLYK